MKKPSPSMWVSIAALVVALGGTSYAAVTIDSGDVQNNTLTGRDIKQKSLTGKDVQDGSLKVKDLKPGTLPKIPVATRWLLVNAAGQIEAQSGGFEIKVAYDAVNNTGAAVPGGAIRNVYIDANEPLDDNGIVATIALQNQVDQSSPANAVNNGTVPGSDTNPEFSGEITTTRCAIVGVVACAPTGTNDANHFVVSPRLSDGGFTDSTNRKRFYIVVTGDSSDYVGP